MLRESLANLGINLDRRVCDIDLSVWKEARTPERHQGSESVFLVVQRNGSFRLDRSFSPDLAHSYIHLNLASRDVKMFVQVGGGQSLYYCLVNEHLIIGRLISDLLPALRAAGGKPAFNKKAAVYSLVFDTFPDCETLYEGLTGIAMGKEVTWNGRNGTLSERFLWVPKYGDKSFAHLSFEEAVERYCQAFESFDLPSDDQVLPLSGGLDSRLILGLLLRKGVGVRCYTFGYGRSFDVKLARNVSRSVHCDFYEVALSDQDYDRVADGVLLRSGGALSAMHSHAATTLLKLPPEWQSDCKVFGYWGDAIAGSVADLPTLDRPLEVVQALIPNGLSFAGLEESGYADWIYNRLSDYFKARDLGSGYALEHLRVALRNERMLAHIFDYAEEFGEVYRPLLKPDYADFTIGIPKAFRMERAAYKVAAKRLFPELFSLPSTDSSLAKTLLAPIETKLTRLTMRLSSRFAWDNQFMFERHHKLLSTSMRERLRESAERLYARLDLPVPEFGLGDPYRINSKLCFRTMACDLIAQDIEAERG